MGPATASTTQTLCGLAHIDFRQKATHDVSQLFLAIDQLGLDYAAREEAFRRVAFNVMAANCDDHSKNVSFLLREGGAWELAPAYDVTHAYNQKGEWTYQHLMSVNEKFAAIGRDDLLAVAWPDFAAEGHVRASEVKRIKAHHRRL